MLTAVQGAAVALLLLALILRAGMLRGAGIPVPVARLACAAVGCVVIVVAVLALDGEGDRLLYWHTVQQLLIGDLAPLLLAIGLTTAMLAPLSRTPLRYAAILADPRIALSLWTANIVIWQLSGPFDAALAHHWLHIVQRVLLVVLGVAMWTPLVGQSTLRGRMPVGMRVAYLLYTRLVGAALGCLAIWASFVYYPRYLSSDSASSISPLADQGIAGAILLGEMALVTVAMLWWMRRSTVARASTAPAGEAALQQADHAAGRAPVAVDA